MSTTARSETELRHATTVAIRGRGLMIEGESGSGKSALALELLALGARLVADDGTVLRPDRTGRRIWADAADGLPERIEARGVGLIAERLTGPAPLYAVLALGELETARLPEPRRTEILGLPVARFARPPRGPLPAVLMRLVGGMPRPLS